MNLKLQMSTKHVQISKAQSTMLAVTAAATVISVFCLVSSKALIAQAKFQSHVISARSAAADQLQANVETAKNLATQYNQVFENSGPTNVLGGQNTTSATAVPPDGDNGRIVIDALPTSYDYPALLTSLSKLMAQDGIGTPAIGGSDQSTLVDNTPSSNPTATNIDVTISGTSGYKSVQSLVRDLERSIRPFDITKFSLNGSENNMAMSLSVTTYYQPAKTLNLNTKEVH